MQIGIPVNIPDGETCRHEDGSLCCLYNPGIEGRPRCWGWGNKLEIIDLKKHSMCIDYMTGALYSEGFIW
ncbi:hypothetical protein A2996_03320 [Candidatus Campbellbacteria bacterium RIFCSPLOWO2_01_FULL_34_15]|uniref:Uncharacterized protein n=2 Tax=Candidatus Campbelliibacteriota TaxID=1752727 RepID=A0A1F5EPN2_9BACT|nr:MAG: hypothetical protein A2811_01140 [Candidatus Campbellbacteria bacterium RIFCSPHIGHO2_01_FULL_34_10]OGD69351.1 MAG: hypothetical protein A2996_03320 [Candidatus Campbellbacteria bacterium RIFCSPLOWO2_01_FULL_34_15]